MYNIQVEGVHTYVVGTVQVLVHNKAQQNPFSTRVLRENAQGRVVEIFYGGKGQATKVESHRQAQMETMVEELLAAGKYDKIYINTDFRVVHPGWKGGGRPDLIAVGRDGRITVIEIAHPTQTTADLLGQVKPYWEFMTQNTPKKAGDIILVDPRMVGGKVKPDMEFFPSFGPDGKPLPIPFSNK